MILSIYNQKIIKGHKEVISRVRIEVKYGEGDDSISVVMFHKEIDIILFLCVDPPINHLPLINDGVLNIS